MLKGKLAFIFANSIRVLLILSIIRMIVMPGTMDNLLSVFVVSLCLFLTYLPAMIARRWNIYLPISLQIIIIFFVFASIFLGEIHSFYLKIMWWDKMLHTVSGIILGIVGFILTHTLNNSKETRIKLSPIFVCFFAFTFAVAMGAIWEIFEYSMDSFYGFNMQKDGLNDTMQDIIVDTISTALVAVFGFIYLKFTSKKRFKYDINKNGVLKNDKKKLLI